jgi:hypothetical protein
MVRPAGLRQATQGSGTDPDDPDRNREARARRVEGGQDELGEQICLGPHIRQRMTLFLGAPASPRMNNEDRLQAKP